MDDNDWIHKAIMKYGEKTETYNKQIKELPSPSFKHTQHDDIKLLVTILFDGLSEDIQQDIVEEVENYRKHYGSSVGRNTKRYEMEFIERTWLRLIDDSSDQSELNGVTLAAAIKNVWEKFQKVALLKNNNGDVLSFTKILSISENQNVYLVTDSKTNTEWVAKWELGIEQKEKGENLEALEYDKLRKMGAQCPDTKNGYKFANIPVLVIERLYPIDITDNPLVMARQILTTQLKYIHTYGCHFDLKTDNIMKRLSSPVYFIIDMNLSKQALPGGGYQRLHFTPLYKSQSLPPSFAQYVDRRLKSTYVNDFIELGYVVNQLIAERAYRTNYNGFLSSINDLQKHVGGYVNVFADPDTMNKDTTTRASKYGWKIMRTILKHSFDIDTGAIVGSYFHYVKNLPFSFPPQNVHELVANTFGEKAYDRFIENTPIQNNVKCFVCTLVTDKIYKCAECYTQNTYVCSKDCARFHKCL